MGFSSPVLKTQQHFGHFKSQEVVPLINTHMDFLLMLHTCLWPTVKLLKLLVGGKPSQVRQSTKVQASKMCKFELCILSPGSSNRQVN